MYMYVCKYVCMYICMYVYIYTHIHTHTQTTRTNNQLTINKLDIQTKHNNNNNNNNSNNNNNNKRKHEQPNDDTNTQLKHTLAFSPKLKGKVERGAASLRTKLPDFGGFDSSRILISRAGILMSIRNFPESLSQRILARIDTYI